jgi:hypothetical protein
MTPKDWAEFRRIEGEILVLMIRRDRAHAEIAEMRVELKKLKEKMEDKGGDYDQVVPTRP